MSYETSDGRLPLYEGQVSREEPHKEQANCVGYESPVMAVSVAFQLFEKEPDLALESYYFLKITPLEGHCVQGADCRRSYHVSLGGFASLLVERHDESPSEFLRVVAVWRAVMFLFVFIDQALGTTFSGVACIIVCIAAFTVAYVENGVLNFPHLKHCGYEMLPHKPEDHPQLSGYAIEVPGWDPVGVCIACDGCNGTVQRFRKTFGPSESWDRGSSPGWFVIVPYTVIPNYQKSKKLNRKSGFDKHIHGIIGK
ncbi:hypothetical protein B0H10DRAFT_1972235 [Mycena sp. CBHHK59/15]|nr:hypothetical protein B0H10DRAFT_1972235 [Mycena sp. CBHHK59/15]